MTKRILLAFDGSGENPALNGPDENTDSGLSNVLKLHLLAGGSIDPDLTKANVPNQICLYSEGVGATSKNHNFFDQINFYLGMLGQQINPIMERLEKIFEEGDQLYILGFSRGSASAREFVVKLSKRGLRTASGKKVENPPVEFLGCFDTVSAQLWSPIKRFLFYVRLITGGIVSSELLGEEDGQISSIVKIAVHNVSLDDPRARTFTPVLMDSKDERVHEVWFPGNHADVGGGYYVSGVAQVSGQYMKKFMEQAGMVFLTPEQVDSGNLKVPTNSAVKIGPKDLSLEPNATGDSHQQATECHRPIRVVSKDEVVENGTVRIHESIIERLQKDSKTIKSREDDKTENIPYEINPGIKEGSFVVVGDLDEELPEKTEELKKILQL